MIYDILIVGAGISAATISAILGKKKKICVIDTRDHIGGNCYDYLEDDMYIHKYGPHIFHSGNKKIVDFLSQYTIFNPYEHSVFAEINFNDKLIRVPFPYSKETTKVLGRELEHTEIIEYFFRGYSEKMWGCEWDNLPPEITGRIPQQNLETSNYFPGEFVGLPDRGYSTMMEKMFKDVDVFLNADEDEWHTISAENILYCGRMDRILLNEEKRVQDLYHELPYRTLNIVPTNKKSHGVVLNICHQLDDAIRYVNYGPLNEVLARMIFAEYPIAAKKDDIEPFYPIPFDENKILYIKCYNIVREEFDNLIPMGRLGNYMYLDMDEAVERAIQIAKDI